MLKPVSSDIDELGVDVQGNFSDDLYHSAHAAAGNRNSLCRSYNRWMADIWRQAKDRLRWVAVLPLLSMDKVYDGRNSRRKTAQSAFFRGSWRICC